MNKKAELPPLVKFLMFGLILFFLIIIVVQTYEPPCKRHYEIVFPDGSKDFCDRVDGTYAYNCEKSYRYVGLTNVKVDWVCIK